MKASTLVLSTLMLMVLIFTFQPYQASHAQTAVPLESKALAYVTNVLPFDMNHYNVTIGKTYSLPSSPNDPTVTKAIDIDLKSSDNTILVNCVYVNDGLQQCGISFTSGSPVSDKPYGTLKEMATRILQKHQEQTGLDSTGHINTLN